MKLSWISIVLLILAPGFVFCCGHERVEAASHWEVTGRNRIHLYVPRADNLPISDDIEMAGKRVAGIVEYSIDEGGQLSLGRKIFFPQLHQYKSSNSSWFHDYRAYLQENYTDDILPKLYLNREQFVPGAVESVAIDGTLHFEHYASKHGLALARVLFPSMDERLFCERWTLKNTTTDVLEIVAGNTSRQLEDFGAKGKFTRRVVSNVPEHTSLQPGASFSFSINIMAKMDGEHFPSASAADALARRRRFLEQMAGSLQLETPNPVLNALFGFSKIRAAESIYESELGLIHSPGGGRYYVGIWANDQAEYVNPFFPYLGYATGNESAMNAYRAFARETNQEYEKIRYSFEIEGLVKPFLKDRGDAAMIAFGAAHFAMASGNHETAMELWPLIEWCLEYSHRQLNEEGVVQSETDEMEGRIETGTANLSTSSLYFGALNHAVDLGRSLGRPDAQLTKYSAQADRLKQSIEDFFGARVEGLETYKYYKEHRHLRHWICLPLVVGIHNRSEATTEALFERLWTDNGVHVEKNSGNEDVSRVFWDRGTLYALRGTFIAGATRQSLEKLEQFSKKRLLGARVPYVVEASPEGNMAHLSAESALYCRIFTEGLFGIRPTGLKSFDMTPRLPDEWDVMALRKIKAFGEDFDIVVSRIDDRVEIQIVDHNNVLVKKMVRPGESIQVVFE